MRSHQLPSLLTKPCPKNLLFQAGPFELLLLRFKSWQTIGDGKDIKISGIPRIGAGILGALGQLPDVDVQMTS